MTPLAEVLGESAAIQAVRATVGRVLAHGVEGRRLPALLILGETGTGKGQLARALHRAGPRAAGPLVEVNCAAIPETLLEAELFGFERGAFTDARQPKAGLFQTAHGGTLFLDEVGLLPERVQAKFLKVLEDQTVRRLGATQSEPADVALVAATSEDLRDAVRARRFREDLYHRLAVVTVRLPSLAERASDILLLAEHFLGRACADYGLGPKTLTPDARAALLAYAWPGNIRELANLMERVALLTETPLVTVDALGLPGPSGPGGATTGERGRTSSLRDAMGTVEREHLLEALRETDWNIARAAARLQIPRGTLRYRIEKLGLRRSGSPPAGWGPPVLHSIPEPTPPPRVGPALGAAPWERRQLAFLRATLVPPPDCDPGPEHARVLEVLAEKAESFGGRVEGLGPLSVVAAFGLEPVEDAPRRAAHAAIAMRKAAGRAQLATSHPVGSKIAIHATQGLVGQVAEGAVIDVAATSRAYAVLEALLTATERGTILVSAAAARALARRFELVPVGSAEPPAYRLEGLERSGLAPRGPMTPLVGRDPELEQLRRALERAAAGHGQVVAIVGEPGVGKSRLVWEATQADRSQGWLVLHATALSYGQATPYLPVVELLKAYFRIEDRDDPPMIREKVAGRLLTLDPALGPSLPALLALLDVPVDDPAWQALDPPQRRQRTFEAIRRLIFRDAQVQPMLLVFEDLQWIDSETQAFLDGLVESLPTARLCLLVDYRPEYQHGWGNKIAYGQLRLDPLAPESAHALLRTLLGEDPGLERLTALLVERTEGNPFFLEEIVQTLVETHALVGERGAHRLARPIDTVEVPATVQAVLAARIDRLPPEARRLLEAASVIGKDAPLALLQAITELPEDTLRRGLATLQAAELLHEARLMPDVEYTFKHTLTRDVAYDGVPHDRRRALHARIVDVIERLSPDRLGEQVERLAHHAVRGEVWEKAVTYLRQAGAKAFGRSANRAAAAAFEEALAASTHLPETEARREREIDLHLDARIALFPLGQPDAEVAHLRDAEQLATRLGDRHRLGWVSLHLSRVQMTTGTPKDTARLAGRARAIAEALEDAALRTAADHQTAFAHLYSGDYRQAARAFQTVVEDLDAGGRRRDRCGLPGFPAATDRGFVASALAELGEFDEGLRHGHAALHLAESLDHAFTLTIACHNLASLFCVRGDPHSARPLIERSLATAQAWDLGRARLGGYVLLGRVHVLSGRIPDAVRLLEQARSESDTLPGIRALEARVWLAEAHRAASRSGEAGAVAAEALSLARARGMRGQEAYALRLLAEISAHPEHLDREAADTHYREALTLATDLGMRPLVAHCHLGLGELYRRTGDRTKADAHLTTAATMYREMDMGLWLAPAEAALSGGG